MSSHAPVLKEKAFFPELYGGLFHPALCPEAATLLSVVCRNTGWGGSALVAVIVWVCNVEGAENKARFGHVFCLWVLNMIHSFLVITSERACLEQLAQQHILTH